MMPTLKSVLAIAALATLASAKTITVTATSDNTFDPSTVKADTGDIVEFHFEPSNHSVVAGEYKTPCSPLPLGSGFFSGYQDTEDGEADKVFRVKITKDEPQVFYSSQGGECPGGMVGIINPNDDMTLEDYKKRAGELARAVAPSKESFGGDLVDNDGKSDDGKDSKDGDDKDGDKDSDDKDSAAGLLQVPVVSLGGVLGVVMYMI